MTDKPDNTELRALILAEALRSIVLVPGPSMPAAVLQSVMARLDRGEEDIAGDLYVSLAMLVRSQLVGCNTADEASVYFNAETVLTPSKGLTSFIWDDAFAASLA